MFFYQWWLYVPDEKCKHNEGFDEDLNCYLCGQSAAQQSVYPTSEAESQIDEDWSNDNDRIGDGLSRFTRG